MPCVRVEGFSLDLSMYPSFLSSLYSYSGRGRWVWRLGGPWAGRVLWVERGGVLCCSGPGCSAGLLRRVSGAWCAEACRGALEGSGYRWLLGLYPGLAVSAAGPGEEVLVAAAVVLSAFTSYASNVRRWMLEIFHGLDPTSPSWVAEASRRAARLRSPQPRRLAAVLPVLARLLQAPGREEGVDPWLIRRRLLMVRGLGPKTVDAILLFTGLTSMVAPGDRHLERFAARVLGFSGRLGGKEWCLRWGPACPSCRARDRCLQGSVVAVFREAAGLVQTIAYVYGRLGLEGWRERLYAELEAWYRG